MSCLLFEMRNNSMTFFSAQYILRKQSVLIIFFTLIIFFSLSACEQEKLIPPSVEPVLSDYIKILHSGDLKQAEHLYFMPLHWRQKEKIFKAFMKEHELLKQNKKYIRLLSFKQKGRWAISILEQRQSGKTQIKPLWLFYYGGRWQVISNIIYNTAPVQAMMDLYREQNDLEFWYKNQLTKPVISLSPETNRELNKQ